MNSYPYQDQPLRVGIVGANSERGWAREAHVPALQKLSGLKLTSVATRSEKSARAAAEALARSIGMTMLSGIKRVGRHRVHLRQGS